ncbi:MAG: UbiA family prenyltransferase [Planctomycetes bacterium]|nr:UbiA family prenyltransferase [Planctomycetota bacterium]
MSHAAPPHTLLASIREVAVDIKIAHSVFALPFAVLAAVMAAAGGGGAGAIAWPGFLGRLTLVALAMVFARTVAMLANRLLDRAIDARNPRTAGRALPSGRLSASFATAALAVSAALFMLVCAAFGFLYGNWWPLGLGLPVLAWISAYALLKRSTALCHLYLGSALAISPLAAALAVDPVALQQQPALWLLAVMVLGWVAGFDVIYALQDLEVDRAEGLHSVPARLGDRGARAVAALLHLAAATALVAAAIVDERFSTLFAAGVAIVVILLAAEHATVARWGRRRIALAFFTLNGIISCVLGALGAADVLMSG